MKASDRPASERKRCKSENRTARRAALILSSALAALGPSPELQAQSSEPSPRLQLASDPPAWSRVQPWSFFGGYTAHELSNFGLHLGAEYALHATPHFESIAAGSFQGYHQPDIETGYALHVRWGQRYTTNVGVTFESHLGIGAQFTRYDTTVFEFQNGIASADESSESLVAFSPHVVFGPGYDFERLLRVPLHLYGRPGVILVYPDLNDAFQVSVVAELGVRWTPGGGTRD